MCGSAGSCWSLNMGYVSYIIMVLRWVVDGDDDDDDDKRRRRRGDKGGDRGRGINTPISPSPFLLPYTV